MSAGYVVYEGNGGSNFNSGQVIAWNQGSANFQSVGILFQNLVTIDLPAGTFTAAGQSIMIEFWGDVTNTTGDTLIKASFDGNDLVGTVNFSLPSGANTRNFYFKAMVTCITPTDEFLQNGIATFSDSFAAGVTITDIVPQNAGGNPFAGAHQILLDVEGQTTTTAMSVDVKNLQVTFLGNGTNIFP